MHLRAPTIPAILMSRKPRVELETLCGADHYLVKPLREQVLLDVILAVSDIFRPATPFHGYN
ncbi:MAG TPA: hypothetical protein VIU40_15760 [Geobacteraceae bacterium]